VFRYPLRSPSLSLVFLLFLHVQIGRHTHGHIFPRH
jgi:hypothetical protein